MKMKNKELILILSPFFLFMGNLYAGTNYENSVNSSREAGFRTTADSQINATQRDTEITRRVRESIVREKDLSTAAKNITIVTKSGQVTLSGAVNNVYERRRIEELTRGVIGNAPVSNQTVISR